MLINLAHLVGAPGCVEPVFKLLPEKIILRLDVIPVSTELKQGLDDSLALEDASKVQQDCTKTPQLTVGPSVHSSCFQETMFPTRSDRHSAAFSM